MTRAALAAEEGIGLQPIWQMSRNPSASKPMGNETHEIACSYEHRQGGLCRILRPVSCPWGFETRRVSAVGFGHDTS